MAIAGALEIQMFANVARLTEDMGKVKGVVGQAMSSVERSVNMAKNALGLLGIGLSVGWAVNFIKSSIDATARMKDLGQEAGVTASAISKFEAPARMAGLGLDSVAAAMFKVSKAALEARDPASAAAQALAAIGISTAQLKGLKPDEMFELVARSVAKYADGLEKNNVMQALFGKSGREMNRVVAEIADARKLSATVTDEEAEAADRLGDQLVELKMNSERAWRSIIAEGVPAMNDIVKAFIEGQKQGGLLRGILDGLASAFDKMGGNAAERLARINDQIKLAMENDATRGSRSFFGIESGAAYDVNDLLARRAVLEKTIFDQELAAQDKRATAGLEGKKPTINFDPAANAVAAAAAKKAEAEAIKEAEKALVAYVKAAMDALAIDEDLATGLADIEDKRTAGVLATEKVIAQMEFENSLLGLTNVERETAIALRAMETAGIAKQDTAYAQLGIRLKAAIVTKEAQQAAKDLAAYLDPNRARQFGASLRDAFNGAGAALVNLVNVMKDYGAREKEIAEMREKAALLDPIARKQAELALDEKATQFKLGAYGDMAAAASGFFDEQSRGYKALQAVSQVFHAAELAMTIAELVPKAISAVLNQGNGDPYTAFFRMAAMAAIVAGLGVAIGGGGGGGGAPSSKDRQAAAGTGSILGDAKAKSDSIDKALTLLGNTSILGNEHTAAMMRSLRSIDNNIGGLSALVARSTGLTGDTTGLSLGGSGNALFGKTTRTLDDSGIQFNAQTIAAARAGVSASGYTDITTNKSSFFGLFKSSSTSRDVQALSGEITGQFTLIVNDLFNSILAAAKVFGSNEGAIATILDAFQIDVQSISFKDLTGDEIEKELRAVFSKIGDDMAGAAFTGLERFQTVGEGLFATLMRLAQEFTATDMVARILGKNVATAFGAVGFASMGARDALVQLFGGLQEMSDAVTKFYDLFYTASEKNMLAVDTLTQQFDALGLSVPASAAAFRDLVTAQDLSTEAGRGAFAALVQLAPAFKQITDYAKQFDDARATIGSTIEDAIRALTFGTLDSSGQYKLLQTEAQTLKDSLGGMTDSAMITSTIAQIVGLSNQAFGMLDADEQRARLDEFIVGLKSAQGEADTRLTALQREAADHAAAVLAEQRAIAETERETALMNRETAAIERETANFNAGTAREPLQVVVVGGGGGSESGS